MKAPLLILSIPALVSAGDPSTSWLSYAVYEAGSIITQMNATVVVPSNPAATGADPSFWYGLQTAKGTGALVQPILAWGQTERDEFGIFHEVYDWNNGRDYRSPESYIVPAGDVLYQSVTYRAENNSYDMFISSNATGKSILWNYALQESQTVAETTAFIVVEHQPRSCDMFPSDGGIVFSDIYIEVDYEAVENPSWKTIQERPACDSEAQVVDPSTIKLTWDPTA